MQEELNDANNSQTSENTSAMTFTETADILSNSRHSNTAPEYNSSPLVEFKQGPSTDFENEIEKMIPESATSSDTEDDLKTEAALKATPEIIKSLHEQNPNESIRTWLHRITQMQNQIQKKMHVSHSDVKATPPPSTPSRVVKYQDLPYMGEMTLDNSKPRRGRKPKKADICHLIYKNYGTIFPGTPNAKSIVDKDKKAEHKEAENVNRTDVQNRIISSLLEKRLTQESKRHKEAAKTKTQHEPLNLCIRDLDHLKIRLMNKAEQVEVKSEPQSDDDVEIVGEPEFKFPLAPNDLTPPVLPPDAIKVPENGVNPGGYVYWPNAGVFIHPIALQQQLFYYQKMAANNNNNSLPSTSPAPAPEQHELRKLVPKQAKSKKSDTSEDETHSENKSKRNAGGSDKTPAKRKRSAIFIPPIPSENQNNPATEVSICKFKFTGGAKPSLQEKKMLSVDSGGNFRYYSGTGDKSMRGYEFFPRETLQQQVHNAQGSSTGAFLQASGEKIYPTSPVDFNSQNEFMLTPEIQNPTPSISDTTKSRKRKSRKSIQREKLEQTFKEKGFLIQTQQLESAEGATYCKFRQLRKFTRYLFRSWKDYLPGNVAENADGEKPPELEEITEQDIENMSNISSPGIEEDAIQPP